MPVTAESGATLGVFLCERQHMTLTRPGCSRLWLSAQDRRPAPWEARAKCLTCPIGAMNSGRTIAPTAGITECLRQICPRCVRPTTRLINGRLCVSCYNRQREVVVGRNAKGNPPTLVLYAARIAVIVEGGVREVEQSLVVSAAEMLIAAARKATGSMAFSRAAARV